MHVCLKFDASITNISGVIGNNVAKIKKIGAQKDY